MKIKRNDIKLLADPERVLARYLYFRDDKRIKRILSDVLALDESVVGETLQQVLKEFEIRHNGFRNLLMKNYARVEKYISSPSALSPERKLLLGSYFTHEYSVEAAALFNPSIVRHPDQDGVKPGEERFILSLRATGEGHISSIEFSSGRISEKGEIVLDPRPGKLEGPGKSENMKFSKDFVAKRARYYNDFNASVLESLPERFSVEDAEKKIMDLDKSSAGKFSSTRKALNEIFDSNYDVSFDQGTALGSRVIFPASKSESGGMEDLRFVEFSENANTRYIGTFTAYNGKKIRPKIIETTDFISFKIRALYGKAASDKGMALFPEKINGKYAMISRQGGESISIMYSDDLCFWDEYKTIQKPQRNWELTQLGNCGSPIKTTSGWLLLTHAVGPMRKYVISASLLDLANPGLVLASLEEPLISANSTERSGYVPNVVYTCGIMPNFDNMIIPYAMSDSAISFASVTTRLLIEKILNK